MALRDAAKIVAQVAEFHPRNWGRHGAKKAAAEIHALIAREEGK